MVYINGYYIWISICASRHSRQLQEYLFGSKIWFYFIQHSQGCFPVMLENQEAKLRMHLVWLLSKLATPQGWRVFYCSAIYCGIEIYSLTIMRMSVIEYVTYYYSFYIILDSTMLLPCKFCGLISSWSCFLATSKMNKSYPTVFMHMKYSSELPQQIVPYDHTKPSGWYWKKSST
jgi:hypothetical protein